MSGKVNDMLQEYESWLNQVDKTNQAAYWSLVEDYDKLSKDAKMEFEWSFNTYSLFQGVNIL